MTINEGQATVDVALNDLIREIEGVHADGYRLVQIGCTDIGEAYEINYSFDKGYHLKNLRLTVTPDVEIPSISGLYWGAFVYENELHDLYGIQVIGMNIDFKGTFFKTAEKYPLSITRRGGDRCQDA